MNAEVRERVEAYCEKQEKILQEKLRRKREKDLIKRGFYDVEYSDQPHSGFVYSVKHKQYIKKHPLVVSDEAYEKIKAYKVNEIKKSNQGILLFIIIFITSFFSCAVLVVYLQIWGVIIYLSFLISIIFVLYHNKMELLEEIKQKLEENDE